MSWRGIVGKVFRTEAELAGYFKNFTPGPFKPKFVVVHNTDAPDMATYKKWVDRGSPTDEQWALNLQGFYRDQQKWSAGPHWFVTPRSWIAFTPMGLQGTHTPSWNDRSLGIETVGSFESKDKFEGPIKVNLIALLGMLHKKFGFTPLPYQLGVKGLHFHKEDKGTTHKTCPGKSMNKVLLITDVQNYMKAH